ncbi:MAG TPA: hypothetical protein VG733_11290 [Chthoniobacteraceae bacterium]|nr:hypothetical protein [Chthoniobacteraceae bacterium]
MRESTSKITLGVCLIVCGALPPMAAYVATRFIPPKYTSKASIEIKVDQKPAVISGSDQSGPIDPHFMADQIEILRSTGILYPVIHDLNLVDVRSSGFPIRLTMEQAYGRLVPLVKISRRSNTSILDIAVTSTDRQEAADIANAIASTYLQRRHNDLQQRIDNALSELHGEVEKQRREVEKHMQELDEMRLRDMDVEVNPGAPGDVAAKGQLLADEAKTAEADQKAQELQDKVEKLNKMSNEELMDALPRLDIAAPADVSSLLQKYKEGAFQRQRLSQWSHLPLANIKELDAQLAVLKNQLYDEMDSFRKTLQTQLETAQSYSAQLQEVYNSDLGKADEMRRSDADYLKAKEEYLSAKKLLDAAEQHYQADKRLLEASLTAETWTHAEPAESPSSPNILLYMVVSGGIGVLLAFRGARVISRDGLPLPIRRSSFTTFGICLILFGVLLPVAAYCVFSLIPPRYTSKVSITIEADSRPINISAPNPSAPVDPHFVADQMKILQSTVILDPVIKELNLVDKWSAGSQAKLSQQQAYNKLALMVKISERRGANILDVAVTSTDRQEAEDIANTIAVIYQKRRRDDLHERISEALAEMRDEIDKKRVEVNKMQADLAKLRENSAIQDPSPETDTPLVVPNPEYEEAKKKYLEAKKLLDAADEKYTADRMQLMIEYDPAEIWDKAEPAVPSGPDITKIMIVSGSIGLLSVLAGIGLVFAGMNTRRRESLACGVPVV